MFQKKIIAGLEPVLSSKTYCLGSKIGSGSFANVFSVVSLADAGALSLALKIFSESINESEFEKIFIREKEMSVLVKGSAYCSELLDFGKMAERGFGKVLAANKLNYGRFLLFPYYQEGDLSKFLQKNKFDMGGVISLAHQMFSALTHLSSMNIIHGDLKPANIFVKSYGKYVLGDFGLSYLEGDKIPNEGNIQTRWYRSPEVSLQAEPYTGAIDIWSLAAVLYECLKRTPLLPSRSDEGHFSLIVESVGAHYHQLSGAMQRGLKAVDPEFNAEFETNHFSRDYIMFKGIDPGLMTLLDKMLVYNPEERLTASAALQSSIFNG